MSYAMVWMIRILLFANFLGLSFSIEPISTIWGAAAVLAAGVSYYDQTYCRLTECCGRYSISPDASNITAFKDVLRSSVYGQHIMQDVVVRALHGHLSSSEPAKALVMSFHGPTGCGKTFVSRIIAESIYAKGMQSSFVRKFIGGKDFPNNSPSDVAVYKMKLQNEIVAATKKCGKGLFIFEDVHRMPPSVVDALVPFMDYHDEIEGTDFRKSIFIFLSNTGAKLLNQKTLELWSSGRLREDMTLKDFESIIRQVAFNEEGGLHKAEAILTSLIDYHVPFLPLEEKHVRLCIEDAFKKYGYESPPQGAVEKILEDMTFMPEGQELFSSSGCKRVEARVGSVVHGHFFTRF